MGGQRSTSRSAVLAVVAGSLAVLAAVGAAQGSLSRDPAAGTPSRDPVPAARSVAAATTNRPALSGPPEAREEVVEIFRRRSSALAAGDRTAWESTVADAASDAGRDQLVAYDNLRALRVTELAVGDIAAAAQSAAGRAAEDPAGGVPPLSGGREAPSAVSLVVSVGHRIAGFDRAPRFAPRTVTLVPGPDGWRVARDRSPTDPLQVWDLPGLQVRRSDTVLMAGNAGADALAQRLADAEAGQARVRDVLGASVPAVLVVPATAREAARQLGRPDGSALGQMAASTDGPAEPVATADRVVLNPDAFAGLTDQGRRVVVAHELAHVTARASMPGRVPLWLSEGLAEHVAWGPVDMPVQTAAAALMGRVRSAGAPTTFPADGDFEPARGDVATAYQAAWLAVRHLAHTYGDERVLAFYRAVAGSPGTEPLQLAVERAFVAELGTTLAHAEHEWRALLEQLAR